VVKLLVNYGAKFGTDNPQVLKEECKNKQIIKFLEEKKMW